MPFRCIRLPWRGILLGVGLVLASYAVADGHPAGRPPLRLALPTTFEAPSSVLSESFSSSIEPPRVSKANTRTPGQVRFRTHLLMWSAIGIEGLYGAFDWWKTGFQSDFRTTNEGWFSQDTYTGGADKLGHAYSAYLGARLLAMGYRWAGNGRGRATEMAGLTTFLVLSGVEVIDGFSRSYRFSPQDVVMNAAGTGLGMLMEKFPALDNLFAFRLKYWPSKYTTFNPADDYSGQTYLLALKASGIPTLRDTPVVRYLEFEVGYGTRDFESHDSALHRRYIYVGIALNLSQVLNDTIFRGAHKGSIAQRTTDTFLKYVQVPGTALLHRNPLSH